MRCLVLFSGGLESMLAARLMQLQGIEPVGVFFDALCARRQFPWAQAEQLGMPLSVVGARDYETAILHPALGRTKHAAACLDCRVQLLREAKCLMPLRGAAFVVSGEVLGQRPRSQNRNDLETVAYHADLEHLLVRPLSAKLLPETLPEREKWIDREQLHAFHGSARKGLIQLARELGLHDLPPSRPACGLADRALSARLLDHVQHPTEQDAAILHLIKIGRHFRFDAATKVIVGRDEKENERFVRWFGRDEHTAVLQPANFTGPTALLLGDLTADSAVFAAALVKRFSKRRVENPLIRMMHHGQSSELAVFDDPRAAAANAIGGGS